ncbi:formate transporter FocA [Chloroflexota bacterium]
MSAQRLPEEILESGLIDLLPAEMARRGEEIGVLKANLNYVSMYALAVLAGAFISLGAIFATVAWTTPGVDIPWGWGRIIGGLVFSLGLILVIVGGAELFTGNNLIIMAWASRRLSTRKVLRNWWVVYLGNAVGAIATAGVVFAARHYMMADGAVGLTALNIGLAKCNLDFVQAMLLGVLCNTLVCLAVWLTYSARSTIGRIAAIVFPITAFVAAGFEHCVANMYFIPYALFIKSGAPDTFWQAVGASPADYQSLSWGYFLCNNLIPVTIGNMIGGVFFVALVYWSVYLHKR